MDLNAVRLSKGALWNVDDLRNAKGQCMTPGAGIMGGGLATLPRK